MKGLRVNIYKPHYGDRSNGGISSKAGKATLVPSADFPGVPEIFEAGEDAPAIALVKRNIGGEYLTAYPIGEDGTVDNAGRMFGGCYVSTSDSRFPAKYPVPLHDRKEW